VCTEANTATHAADYEGSPRRRPFTREELQALFDHADAQVGKAVTAGRKGAVAAFRTRRRSKSSTRGDCADAKR
jgi:hypothetical protein